jgi:hypothetical protein
MTFYSALHYAAKAEKSAIAAKESADKASQASGEIVQLGFDGSMEDGRLVFKHAPSGVEIPYDLLNNYEYEIDMAYTSLDSLSDDLQVVVRNGSDIINFVSSLHRSSTESIKIVDMKQVMRFNSSTGYRWLFKASYKITPAGDKVFLLYPVVTNTSTLDETITGQKTFTSYPIIATDTFTKLRIESQTLDIDTNPTEQKNNQIWFADKNGVQYAVLQANKNTDGSANFSMTMKAKSSNSFTTLNIVQQADGTSYATAPSSTAKNSIVTTTGINKAGNGYVKLGNGIIIQWGAISGGDNVSVTFPAAFTSTNYGLCITYHTDATGTNYGYSPKVRSKTSTGFKAYTNTQGRWIAIGY